nr:DUF4013 domain-containing protein [uncultured Methanoregula sp.]
MDYGAMIDEALGYSKAGVFNRMDRWLKLILAAILIGIPLNGWILRIYRGGNPAPEVDRWGTLFVDGFKLFVIGLIYSLPLIILSLVPYLIFPGGMAGGHPPTGTVVQYSNAEIGTSIALLFLLLAIQLIYDIFLAIFMPVAAIRFARTGVFSEAFNFGAIIGTIRKIGWLNYILAIILIAIIIGIPVGILAAAILIGGFMLGHYFIALGVLIIVILIIAPPLVTFQARYMTRVYDQSEPAGTSGENPAATLP